MLPEDKLTLERVIGTAKTQAGKELAMAWYSLRHKMPLAAGEANGEIIDMMAYSLMSPADDPDNCYARNVFTAITILDDQFMRTSPETHQGIIENIMAVLRAEDGPEILRNELRERYLDNDMMKHSPLSRQYRDAPRAQTQNQSSDPIEELITQLSFSDPTRRQQQRSYKC